MDVSNPQMIRQIQSGLRDTAEFGYFRKADHYSFLIRLIKFRKKTGQASEISRADKEVYISAKQGIGLDRLLEAAEDILKAGRMYLEKVFDYQEAGSIAMIRKHGQLIAEEYTGDGIAVKALGARGYLCTFHEK